MPCDHVYMGLVLVVLAPLSIATFMLALTSWQERRRPREKSRWPTDQ